MKKIFILMLGIMLLTVTAFAAEKGYGAKGAATDDKLTLQSMMTYTLEEEYLARANYKAARTMTGSAKPFTEMIKNSDADIEKMKRIIAEHQLTAPDDNSKIHVTFPFDFNSAKQAGEKMETERSAMYERFLREPELPNDIRILFVQMQNTARKNLCVFQR